MDQRDVVRRSVRWVSVAHGVVVMLSSAAAGPLGWLALSRLAAAVEKGGEGPPADRLAATMIEDPRRILFLVVPAFLCGLGAVMVRRRQWLWFLAGMAMLTGMVGTVLYCLIAVVGRFYEYQPL